MIKIKYLKVRGNISKYSLKKNILQNSIVHKKISLFNPNKNITINKFQNRLEQRIFDEDRAFVMLNRIFSKTEYISTPTKYIEIDKNIIVEKDKLITQLKTKVLKEQQLKEKFININKSFVRDRDIIKNRVENIQNDTIQKIEIDKNIIIQKNKLIKSSVSTKKLKLQVKNRNIIKEIEVDKNIIVEKDKLITQLKTNIIKEKELKLQDKFTTINKLFTKKELVLQFQKEMRLKPSLPKKYTEVDKNIIVEKDNLITQLKTNIIKEQKLKLQDRFTITNKSFVRDRDIIKKRVENIQNDVIQKIEIDKNIIIQKNKLIRSSISTKELKLQDRFTITNKLFVKNRNIIKNKIYNKFGYTKFMAIQYNIIKELQNSMVDLVSPNKKIEVDRNIIVKKDKLITQLKINIIKEQELKLQDRFTTINKLFVRNRVENIQDNIIKIIDKDKLIQNSVKTEPTKELQLQDKFTTINKLFNKKESVLQLQKEMRLKPSLTKKYIEVDKNIIVEKDNLITQLKTNIIKEQELKLQDKYTAINKLFVRNRVENIQDNIIKIIDKDKLIQSSVKTESTKELQLQDKFTTINKLFTKKELVLQLQKEMRVKPSLTKKYIEIDKNIIVEKDNLITQLKTNIIKEEELKLQDKFTITNKSFILNRDIIKYRIENIQNDTIQKIEIDKNIIVEKNNLITKKELVLHLQKEVRLKPSIPKKYIEIDKNIIVEKDNLITQLKTNIIKEQELKLQDKYTAINKLFVKNRVENIQDNITKIIEIDKDKLIQSSVKTEPTKELQLQDKFTTINKLFTKKELVLQLQKEMRVKPSLTKKYIEVDKNIIVEKDNLITQLKTNIIKEQELKLQDKFTITNKSFMKNRDIIQKIEIDKNIVIEKDKLITQLKTNIIKEKELKSQDKFTIINKSFVRNRDIIKNKIYNKFGDTKPTAIQYNTIKKLQNSMVGLVSLNKKIEIDNFITQLKTNIIKEKELKLQDRFTITNKSFVLNRDIIKDRVENIQNDIIQKIEIDKLITQLKTNIIKEKELKLQDKFTITNKSFVRNRDIIKNKIYNKFGDTKPTAIQYNTIKELQNSMLGLVSPNQKIEVDKNILVEKDKLITQLKTNIIKEQELKLQDKFTITNKSFVRNRDIIKNRVENIQNDIIQKIVVDKNIIIKKDKLIQSLIKTEPTKELKLQDKYTTINKLFVRNRDIIKNSVENVQNNIIQKIEIDKNIIVEKNKLITKLKENIIKDSIDNIFTINDRLNYTKNQKIINNNDKDSIVEFVKIPKRKKVTKTENQVVTDNIKYIKKEEKVVDEQFLAPIIEKSVTNKIINIESIIENKFNVELDNFALDIDKLATRIFNELKEELDIGYRV